MMLLFIDLKRKKKHGLRPYRAFFVKAKKKANREEFQQKFQMPQPLVSTKIPMDNLPP